MSALQWVAMALALAPVVVAAAAVAFRIVGEDEERRRRRAFRESVRDLSDHFERRSRASPTGLPEGPWGDEARWGCLTPDGPAIPAEDGPNLIERLADDGQHFIGIDYP